MRRYIRYGLMLIGLLGAVALAQGETNPPLPGFNLEGSDARAVEIADEVMSALGGRRNWDNTRHITWQFFGRRTHVWDKWTGNLRLENKNLLVLMNLNTQQGRAWKDGTEINQPDSLAKYLKAAASAWINDSYWMFMPYKLKDSGVTLTYLGEGQTRDNRPADILQLTFENVGDTPQNKYHVYVDKESRLVTQWAYFSNADDPEPRFINAWSNWQKFGNIMLSDARGDRKHSDIAVFPELPASVYEDPAPVDWTALKH